MLSKPMLSKRCRLIAIGFVAVSAIDVTPAISAGVTSVEGRVVDESGEPVADAKLVLPLNYKQGNEAWQVDATSDAAGKFQLDVPVEWLSPASFQPQRKIWCYARGHALATASAYKQLERQGEEPVEVKLSPETVMEFSLVDPAGEPVEGCRVEPHHWLSGSYDLPPESIRELTAGTSDAEGVAKLIAMDPALLRRVMLNSGKYGRQGMVLNNQQPANKHTIRLRDVGAVEGRLVCEDPKAVANVRVSVDATGGRDGGRTEGSGEAQTDEQGRFQIEHVAEGALSLYVGGDKVEGYRPVIPRQVVVNAGETTQLDIPFEPTVVVKGSVVASGGDKGDRPVANAYVSVSYGVGRQRESVLTDAEGKFTAHVLPGQVRQQLIVIPKPYRKWIRGQNSYEPVEASADSAPLELTPLVIVQPREVVGKLLDAEGNPIAAQWLSAVSGNRNVGSAQVGEDGAFRLSASKDAEIDGYRVQAMDGTPAEVRVVSESPLVLQLVDPQTLTGATVTTLATPDDKLRPPAPEQQSTGPKLIVAKNVLIYEGESTDWATLAERIEKYAAQYPEGQAPAIYYSLTHAAFDDELRKSEAANWGKLLTDTTGATVRQLGIILNQPARRYDALEITDLWPPGADKPIVGRAVNSAGEAVAGAQVVLLLPPPATWEYGQQTVYLRDGQLGRPDNYIVQETDEKGEFQFDFPTAGTSVMIVDPQGFSLSAASDETADLALQPWARVTGTIEQNLKDAGQTVGLSIYAQPTGGGQQVLISMSDGSPSSPPTEFEFIAVPPNQSVSLRRTVWRDEDGRQTGRSAKYPVQFETESGVTTNVEFGPLEEAALQR